MADNEELARSIQTLSAEIHSLREAREAPEAQPTRNKTAAAVFALLLGWIGVHRFYLGRPVSGLIYLVFWWTLIPAIIAFIEGLVLLTMSEASFQAQYGGWTNAQPAASTTPAPAPRGLGGVLVILALLLVALYEAAHLGVIR
jgi:TM2 domain-containing membrane protein YozV